MEKQKDKIKKQEYCIENTKHNRAREIVFLPLPHSVRKIQADFLSKRPHFSRLPPLFYLKPPYPAQTPFHPTRRTRAYAYIRACALTEFAIFAFTFTFTFTAKIWYTTPCTTSIAKNRWRQKGEAFTRNTQSINILHPKGEEVKAKIEKHWTRARAYAYNIDRSRMRVAGLLATQPLK